ncbi:hypothetical protein Tco_0729254 [Tanacetum coccineum]|uniref:Uncharacterized protein n=1 Tax=Tanacetum coccineum TaxID=301880 RepID=A0ABQ4YRW9_9ASTR
MSTSNIHQQSLADAGSETRPPMLERGNGYPRKGQKSKPKRQNQARERKEREAKSKSKSSQSQPWEVDSEKASKTEPENINCKKWAHPYPPSRPGVKAVNLTRTIDAITCITLRG